MMRILAGILLLGNVIFFAAMQWGGLLSGEHATQTQPPLHEERIKLLDAPPSQQADEALPAPAQEAAAPVAAQAAATVQESATMPPVGKPGVLCLEWGEFSGVDLEQAVSALSTLQLGDRLDRREVEYAIGYWVYLPPQKDKAAVAQKVAQLKARGIGEYFVVSEAGQWQNAISLGVFKTREAAQHFLDELRRTKDVRTAQVGERASKIRVTVFVLNGLDATIAANLTEMQKSFAGSELKEVACAH